MWRVSYSTAGLLEYARVSRFRPSGIHKPADRPQMGVNLQFQWIAVAVLLSNAVELFDRDVLFVVIANHILIVPHSAGVTPSLDHVRRMQEFRPRSSGASEGFAHAGFLPMWDLK